MELFAERGFEQTTASDIAARAGVTERTFFRHFADKREVLFSGAALMERATHDAIAAAPDGLSPLEAALTGVYAFGEMLEDRHDFSVLRSRIIAANPGLLEREKMKLASLVDASADALHERGVADPAASLAAHSAVTVFHVAFTQWVSAEGDGRPSFADCIDQTVAALRALK